MATFLEKKSHYVRLTDVSGAPLTVGDNGGLNVTLVGGDVQLTPSITDTCGNAIYATTGAMNVNVVNVPMIGTQNNAYTDANLDGYDSSVIDCSTCCRIGIFGSVATYTGTGGGMRVMVGQGSEDTFVYTGCFIMFEDDLDFYAETNIPARYVMLKTDVTDASFTGLYATVAGKP